MQNGANSVHKLLRTELEDYIKSQYFGKSPLLLSALSNHIDDEGLLYQKFYRFSDYLGTTSQMSELLGISSISGILRFGRYPAYHGISEPHLAVKSSKTVVENRPYY